VDAHSGVLNFHLKIQGKYPGVPCPELQRPAERGRHTPVLLQTVWAWMALMELVLRLVCRISILIMLPSVLFGNAEIA